MNELMKLWGCWTGTAGAYEESIQNLVELQAKANEETSKEIQALIERAIEVNSHIASMALEFQKDLTKLMTSKGE